MEFLARALDDKDPQPCGKCAHCLGQPIVPPTFSHKTVISATRYLRQAELELEPRKLKIPEHLRPRTIRILSRWKDGHLEERGLGASIEANFIIGSQSGFIE